MEAWKLNHQDLRTASCPPPFDSWINRTFTPHSWRCGDILLLLILSHSIIPLLHLDSFWHYNLAPSFCFALVGVFIAVFIITVHILFSLWTSRRQGISLQPRWQQTKLIWEQILQNAAKKLLSVGFIKIFYNKALIIPSCDYCVLYDSAVKWKALTQKGTNHKQWSDTGFPRALDKREQVRPVQIKGAATL